jgi:hypothetical protein
VLSALAIPAVLTALVAGIAGAWSPCGFSMLETIGTGLGDARRGVTAAACATFAAGAVLGGALTFGGLAFAGSLIPRHGTGVRDALGVVLVLGAAVADWRGLQIAPQIRRQVPERWRWTMPLSLASGLFGLLLGLGFTTFVLAFAVWALAGLSFIAGSTGLGLLIGLAFGLGRALPVILIAPRLRGGRGMRALEGMAREPRLWLGLRRLDAIGLAFCALLLTSAGARGAQVAAGSDPSARGGALAWQTIGGPGMLRDAVGRLSALPGTYPALGRSSVAWFLGGQVIVAHLASMTVEASIAAGPISALAISDSWIAYRAPAPGGGEQLVGVPLGSPARPRSVASSPRAGSLGRPSLIGSTVVFARDTPRRAAIVAVNLATGARHVLRSARGGVALLNPALTARRLMYERITRCSQELRVGPARAPRRDRTILRAASAVFRDSGYERGYVRAYNEASLCRHRKGGPGGPVRLGATALAAGTAYVTEVPVAAGANARILALAATRRR